MRLKNADWLIMYHDRCIMRTIVVLVIVPHVMSRCDIPDTPVYHVPIILNRPSILMDPVSGHKTLDQIAEI